MVLPDFFRISIMLNIRGQYLINCFYYNGKYILFDGRTYAIIEMDKLMAERFLNKQTVRNNDNNIDHEISSLINKHLLSKDECDTSIMPNFRRLIVLLTTACNLRCKYCFERHQKQQQHLTMTRQTARHCIEYLINHSPEKVVELHFFGGEPLLNFPLIKYFVKLGNKLANKCDKSIRYLIVTNGTIITDESAKFFSNSDFRVQISIDGHQKAHDANRLFPNGAGSYDKICRNIRHLNGNNVNYSVLSVASKQLLKTKDNWFQNIKSISKGNYDFCFVADKRATIRPNKIEIRRCLNDYKKYLRVNTGNYKIKDHGIISVTKNQKAILNGYRYYYGCGAASEELTIMPNGDINICQRLSGVTSHNIRENIPPKKLWSTYAHSAYARSVKDKTCNHCWAKYLCGGGCRHTSNLFTNNKKPVWWECAKKKLEIETAIKVLYNNMVIGNA